MYDGIIYITQNVSRHLVYATLFWFDSERSMFAYAKHSRIHSWNQQVLSNEGKVACPRKQQESDRIELTADRLQVTLRKVKPFFRT